MDMSLVTAALGLQAGNTQTQIATAVLKQNLDAQRQTVEALLGTGSQGANSLANVGADASLSDSPEAFAAFARAPRELVSVAASVTVAESGRHAASANFDLGGEPCSDTGKRITSDLTQVKPVSYPRGHADGVHP